MSNGTTQRRSIFGGLLLILIGALFLVHYHVPGLGIGTLFRHYWPVLLIIWGLAKLFDYFAAQGTGQRNPPILTGGEIALIILLLLVGGGLAGTEFIHRRNPDINIFGPIFTHSVTSTEEIPAQPVKPGAKITVTTDRGNVTIRPDESNNIRVIVNKTVSASSDNEAQQLAKAVRVVVSPVADGYDVRPQIEGEGGAKVDLEVHVPKNVTMVVRTERGDVSAADLEGAVSIAARNGDVELHDIAADVSAEMQHGDARITGVHGNVRLTGRGSEVELADITGEVTVEGEFYGPIRMRNVAKTARYTSSHTDLTIVQLPGHLELDSGRLEISDTQGGVNLVTKNKDVVMENVAGRIHIEDRHGDIHVQFRQPPHEEISIANDSGEIELKLPPSSSFEIAASSRNGEVQSEFQDPALKATTDGDTSKLNGKVGARGPQIRLSTSYGTIAIRKGP